MNKKMKSAITTTALASMIWTGGLATGITAHAASSPFSDTLPAWAEKHITKLAMQGILKGANGKFNPNVQMTREQAVLVALRFMGIYDQANLTEVLVFPSSLQIKTDYKPYLKLAFQKKILLLDEEVDLAEKEGKAWGSSPATREWITRLLVRALGKDADAKAAEAEATTFDDDSKIDPKLRGYVNAAVDLGLVTGVPVSAGSSKLKFDPTVQVSRATASTLFSRAESKLPVAYAGQVSGSLLEIQADHLTLLHQDGTVKEYKIGEDTSFYRFDSEAASSLAGLRLYGEAVLISNTDGSIGYVEQTSDEAKVKTYEGTFVGITEDSRIALKTNGKITTYTYDTAPTVKDAEGKALALPDLPENVTVKITVDAVRTDGKVLSVAVTQSLANKSGSGTVAAWNAATGSLQVKDSAGATSTLTVSANATFKSNGVNLSADQLKVGDAITYEVKSGQVASVVITKTQQPTVSGVLKSVNKTDKTLQYTVNGKLAAEYLADSVVIKIDGFTDATIDDLAAGDAFTLSFNDKSQVNLITVTNRSVQAVIGAKIIKYDPEVKVLTVEIGGVSRSFNLRASTRIDLGGTSIAIESVTSLLTKDKKINFSYNPSDNSVVYLSLIAKYTGTVVENNVAAKTIKLSIDSSTTLTLPYSYPLVEIFGFNNETIADVRVGDTVTAIMNGNQDQAAQLLVNKPVQLEVISSDANTSKLRTKRDDGTTDEWTIIGSTVLQNENGTAATLASFPAKSMVNVTFQGNTPLKVKAVSLVSGKVVSVNAANNTIDVSTSNGAVVTKSVGASPIIMRGTVNLGSLAAIQANDRVEIRVDESDRLVVQVATVLNKKFWRAEIAANVLYVKSDATTDPTSFVLHSQLYIHQGTTTLGLTDLKLDDAITLYVLRGKVIEIAK